VTVAATELENNKGIATTSIDILKDYRCDILLFLHFQDKSAELTDNLKTHLLRFVSFSGGFAGGFNPFLVTSSPSPVTSFAVVAVSQCCFEFQNPWKQFVDNKHGICNHQQVFL